MSKNGTTWPVVVVLDQYYGIRALYERLGKYNITAPFDGVVVSAPVEPGTIVTPGTRLGEFIAPGFVGVGNGDRRRRIDAGQRR